MRFFFLIEVNIIGLLYWLIVFDFTANHPVQFGGIVSTSNTYASTHLTIDCDNYLFWSMATDSDTCNEYD